MKNIRSNFVVSVMVILFMVLPTLNQTAFQLLTCRTIGDDSYSISRVAGDLDVECFGSTHLAYIVGVAVPGLLVYTVGMPALAIFLLHRKNKANKLFVSREMSYSSNVYMFLYGGYNREHYYWEVIIMLRKVTLNLVLVVMASASALAQGLVVLITLHFCIWAHVRYQPYAEGILNRIELCSLFLAASVLLLGFFLFPYYGPLILFEILNLYIRQKQLLSSNLNCLI